MADRAATTWSGTRNEEAVGGLARTVGTDPQGERDVAAALAAPARSVAQHHARGGTIIVGREGAAFREAMLDTALDLDVPAVVDAFREAEAEPTERLALGPDPNQNRVLDAASDGAITGEGPTGSSPRPSSTPRVSVVPVFVTCNGFGAATIPVYQVQTADGRQVAVDHQEFEHDSVEEWAAENRMPPGKVTHPSGLDLAAVQTTTANTPEVVDSAGEHFKETGRHVQPPLDVGAEARPAPGREPAAKLGGEAARRGEVGPRAARGLADDGKGPLLPGNLGRGARADRHAGGDMAPVRG